MTMLSARSLRSRWIATALAAAVAASVFPSVVVAAGWLGPQTVLATPDGKTLLVANTDAKTIQVVELPGGKATRTIAVPDEPTGMAISSDGKTLYVTCAAVKSTVAVIDVASGKVERRIPAGHTATGLALSPDDATLYVCNRFDTNVSVIDLETDKEVAKVAVVREPIAAVATPDGKSVFVANHLPLDRADSYDVAAMITVIDAETNRAAHIRLLNGSTGLRTIAVSPDGKYVFVPHILARYQMPTTQLERGWMNTNALTIIDAAEKKLVNTVLLDNVDLGAAVPWAVDVSSDGALVCVTHASSHELSVIDFPALMEKLDALAAAGAPGDAYAYSASRRPEDVPNDLAFLVDLRRRIRLPGKGPRGVAVVGAMAYVTEYFTDTLAAVDLEPKPGNPIRPIALGPAPKMTIQRRGELLFNDAADMCFQQWQSCASCHPDARVDGLNWDLLNDGLGNPKNNRSMLLAHRTPPSMSLGVRATAEEAVRAGITHIQFIVRPEEDAVAIDEFLKALKPVPSPYLVDGKLSPAAERGRAIFFDDKIGCAKCHPEPLYTDLQMHDVGSRGKFGRETAFDTPTLIECWRTAPYMHDGQYLTIKELLTKGKHGWSVGQLDKLTEQQIDDLVEFVLSL
jgi:YVTN family beta-propeller protein